MRIQVFSDIHLEFGPLLMPKTNADVIVAAGDIHQQTQALEWLKSLGKPVVYVAGNHELWGDDIEDGIEALRTQCAQSNVHFLEDNQWTLGEVTFFGCSLWTDFDHNNARITRYVKHQMNDFAYIRYRGKAISPNHVVQRHEASLRWLKKSLSRKTAKTQVVVTHHAPSLRSWGFNPKDPIRFAYCSELDDIIRQSKIRLWVHGHVHCRSDYWIRDSRIVCNPRGYYKRRLVEEFELTKIVEV